MDVQNQLQYIFCESVMANGLWSLSQTNQVEILVPTLILSKPKSSLYP